MALTKCPDCGTSVSTKAPTCPSCGCPISTADEVSATHTNLVTTQGTAKKFKLHSLISITLLTLGIVIMFMTNPVPGETASPTGPLMTFVGLVWYIGNRVRIWWHHD